jgi:hypothetical protein
VIFIRSTIIVENCFIAKVIHILKEFVGKLYLKSIVSLNLKLISQAIVPNSDYVTLRKPKSLVHSFVIFVIIFWVKIDFKAQHQDLVPPYLILFVTLSNNVR